MSNILIGSDSKVTLNFSLKLEDGSIIDSTFDKQPAIFTVGDGSLLPGFEKKLSGMQAAEIASFTILPEDSFGQRNPNNIQQFSREDFKQQDELSVGMVISFADARKTELPGIVSKLEGDFVEVDFNHPLAGRTIQFDVEIISVEQAVTS
jgi:FKBP-type peptidyl-prolyl cis-trans isomerase SlpA